ncbi:unnamed protein product (mitochondrion) [Plasmodiophora brassicae]|uniref:t-SNARE coiled-coil homology domain-containing protein n=1 Tax=Plasmodiophora brassicae TaxID=37360 RepID=A0A0G4ILU3_PLABS|nr:hypothetical protein PBRA_004752 [Plasmodiophora brassicae]SPQ93393.1 unnamed protein product [Plasmodiophora brassicae]
MSATVDDRVRLLQERIAQLKASVADCETAGRRVPAVASGDLGHASLQCDEIGSALKAMAQGADRDRLLRIWRTHVQDLSTLKVRIAKVGLDDDVATQKDVPIDVMMRDQVHQREQHQAPSPALEGAVSDVEDTHAAMNQIMQDSKDLADMFHDLKHVVVSQGTVLDEIESNTHKARERAQKAEVSVRQAAHEQSAVVCNARFIMCCLCVVLLLAVVGILLGYWVFPKR